MEEGRKEGERRMKGGRKEGSHGSKAKEARRNWRNKTSRGG